MTTAHQAGRSELWSLREDVRVSRGNGPLRLRSQWGSVTIEQPSAVVREALRRMRLGPVSLENVIEGTDTVRAGTGQAGTGQAGTGQADTGQADTGRAARARLYAVLDRIQPLVIRTLGFGTGQPLLSVVPLTPQARFHPEPLPPDAQVQLSTFAQLRTDGREYRLESPLSLHRVQLHQPEALWLLGRLARPTCASGEIWAPLTDIADDVLAYLAAAGMLDGNDPDGSGWSPADLMFHSRSTSGRHDNAFGITYPLGRAGSPEPVVRTPKPGIALHRPRWEDLAADPPLAIAMEGRRSIRVHGADPVTADELGDLLYRTARVRALVVPPGDETPAPGPEGTSPDPRLSDRPYPGGGACYELELYVTVGRCTGLERGVYRYDPFGHQLEPVNSDPAIVDGLLASAGERATMKTPPQVLITLTARFARISWKYEGLAYATVLKDVGVLFGSLYLACTAMRLAPCALGSVQTDATARALRTDWLLEPSVGQFIVGRSPGTAAEYSWAWQPVNDAQWPDQARERLRRGPA